MTRIPSSTLYQPASHSASRDEVTVSESADRESDEDLESGEEETKAEEKDKKKDKKGGKKRMTHEDRLRERRARERSLM